jgi:peptidoglycan hydrolase-like protein with peptidoglycan-binding domain
MFSIRSAAAIVLAAVQWMALGVPLRAQQSDDAPAAQSGDAPPPPPVVRRPRPRAYRASQKRPTQERYRQIQQALIDRGYLGGPADGLWGPKSQSALKDFEQDQNLNPDGKIDSLALIALGLGPKRDSSLVAPAVPAAPSSPAEPSQP